MSKRCAPVHSRTLSAAAGLLAGLFLLNVLSASPAEARHRHIHHHHQIHHLHHHKRHHHLRHSHHARHFHASAGNAKLAEIVIDGNTGRELYGHNENAIRYPASITKVMTLYLLFEQLQSGRVTLESRIPVSAHAAAQSPTKLNLRPGQTISVDDAIRGIVTQSANDVAVAIAEYLGGTESHFAEMMTRKAHELGMSHTHYADASGLPNPEQLTTAHDLAILGRDIQARFPRYYRYFSIRHFVYHGVRYHNHNHLLGHVEGIDGIKTGYTRASGYNLMTSVKRNGHYIIAVVLGGRTWASRDRIMDNLIEAHIDDGVTRRSPPQYAAIKAEEKKAELSPKEKPAEDADRRESASANRRSKPLARFAAIDPRVPAHFEKPRPAFVSAAPKPMPRANRTDADMGRTEAASFGGTTGRAGGATVTPSTMRWVVGPAPAKEREMAAKHASKAESSHSSPETTGTIPVATSRPANTHRGWMIQIGATDDAIKANELLARAMAKGLDALSSAKPFTEKVHKGSETFYRARFAGLEARTAEAACKSLKRSGFACFATRN
ncbi:MAG: D-alanyl-D-alanine carboxypeptidase [Beijerinckiaceae bacterium]|nr:MAG: D-alanyl-D-alanine carboxypeptidase [Beijerinckiaceae bacterium]